MASQPLAFTGERSGLPISPVELVCIALLAAALSAVQDVWVVVVVALVLGGFLYLARWGAKPTLVASGEYLDYRVGKVASRVKLSEISGVAIKGNAFVGRSLVVSGDVQVAIGDGKRVQRASLTVADAFPQPLEDIRAAIVALAPAMPRKRP